MYLHYLSDSSPVSALFVLHFKHDLRFGLRRKKKIMKDTDFCSPSNHNTAGHRGLAVMETDVLVCLYVGFVCCKLSSRCWERENARTQEEEQESELKALTPRQQLPYITKYVCILSE